MKRARGSTLVEMMVSCALFSVFMTVSLGLFSSMTGTVHKEQQPGERMAEGRLATLTLARRFRNSSSVVKPRLWQLVSASASDIMIRDQVLGKTVQFRIVDGVLTETYFPIDYDPDKPGDVKPEKSLRLTPAQSFQVTSGGIAHPTRITAEIQLLDGRYVRTTTNFREAI